MIQKPETKLERIRIALSNTNLPPWASWVDLALRQEDAESASLRQGVERLRKALDNVISTAFVECQPDHGDLFSKIDDIALRALHETEDLLK